jgi:hypothetical protein
MNRMFRIVASVCLSASTALAQTQMTGSWSTDPAPKGWSGWTESGKPNTFSEQPELTESLKQRPTNPNGYPTAVFVSLKVENSKVSGFLGMDNVWDLPLKIELGTIEGKTIRLMTVRSPLNRDPMYWQWTVELKDDNTMMLRRGNMTVGPGGQAPRNSPAPAALPPLSKSPFGMSLTLHRVK